MTSAPPPTPLLKPVSILSDNAASCSQLDLKKELKPIDTKICRICLKALPKDHIRIIMQEVVYAYCSITCHKKHAERQQQKTAELFAKMALKKQYHWKISEKTKKTGGQNG